MTGDFDDLKFPVKWEIPVHVTHPKKKKKNESSTFPNFPTFARIFRVSKLPRNFAANENFSRRRISRISINNNRTFKWIRRKLRMDIHENKKNKKKLWNVENDGRPSMEAAATASQFIIPSPILSIRVILNRPRNPLRMRFLRIYIYIYTPCNVKLRGNEESGNGLNEISFENGKKEEEKKV